MKKTMFLQCNKDDDFDENKFKFFSIGDMNCNCKCCSSLMYLCEKLKKSSKQNPSFCLCCGTGKVCLPTLPELPSIFIEYLSQNTDEAKYFRKYVRNINALIRDDQINNFDDTELNQTINYQ